MRLFKESYKVSLQVNVIIVNKMGVLKFWDEQFTKRQREECINLVRLVPGRNTFHWQVEHKFVRLIIIVNISVLGTWLRPLYFCRHKVYSSGLRTAGRLASTGRYPAAVYTVLSSTSTSSLCCVSSQSSGRSDSELCSLLTIDSVSWVSTRVSSGSDSDISTSASVIWESRS